MYKYNSILLRNINRQKGNIIYNTLNDVNHYTSINNYDCAKFSCSSFLNRRRHYNCRAYILNKHKSISAGNLVAPDGYVLQKTKEQRKLEFDDYLLLKFKEKFPDATRITTRDQIMTLISINDEVRDFYLDIKSLYEYGESKPDFLSNSEEDKQLWESVKIKIDELNKLNKSWSDREERAANELKAVLSSVKDERNKYYNNLHPILVIKMLTVKNLNRSDAIDIALEGDDLKRSNMIKSKVLALQLECMKHYRAGTFEEFNPFSTPETPSM